MDPHHDKEQRSRLDRLKVFTGRRRFIGSLLLALATSTSQSQVLSSEFFPEMGAPALVERLASGDIIMVTEQNLIRIAPDGTVLSITPIDTCLSGWRADMVIQGDTALIVTCSEELYNIISLSGDSIGSITSPLDNYHGPELVIIPLSHGGIGPMLNGDLLMVNSTTVWCRSGAGDTLWSSSIYTSPFNKMCYLQDAIQLANLDIIVTGYTVVDTEYIYGLDWAYIPGSEGWTLQPVH